MVNETTGNAVDRTSEILGPVADVSRYRQIDFDFVAPSGQAQVKQDLNRLKLAMKTMEAELFAAKGERSSRNGDDAAERQWRIAKTNELIAVRRRYNALKQWTRDHAVPQDDGRRDVRTDLTFVLTGDLVYELKLRVQALERIAVQAIGYRDAFLDERTEGPAAVTRCLEGLRRAVAIYEGLSTVQPQRRESMP